MSHCPVITKFGPAFVKDLPASRRPRMVTQTRGGEREREYAAHGGKSGSLHRPGFSIVSLSTMKKPAKTSRHGTKNSERWHTKIFENIKEE